jgi:hypothetical protein
MMRRASSGKTTTTPPYSWYQRVLELAQVPLSWSSLQEGLPRTLLSWRDQEQGKVSHRHLPPQRGVQEQERESVLLLLPHQPWSWLWQGLEQELPLEQRSWVLGQGLPREQRSSVQEKELHRLRQQRWWPQREDLGLEPALLLLLLLPGQL